MKTHEVTEQFLSQLGIEVTGELASEFLTLCPFHSNTHTAAFCINKDTGLWLCYNPTCGRKGNLEQLVIALTGRTEHEAKRYLAQYTPNIDIEATIKNMFDERRLWHEFDAGAVEKMKALFWENADAQEYMYSRGFNNKTLAAFEVGYSELLDMVAVPIWTHDDELVGVSARALKEKFHKYNKGFPLNYVLFNLHRAKRAGSHAILVESAFDAMSVHQAGYPCVVATLGSSFSDYKADLLNRYFTRVTIMTDNDDAGRKLGKNVESKFQRMVLWTQYPEGAKDPNDMDSEQIQDMVESATVFIDI